MPGDLQLPQLKTDSLGRRLIHRPDVDSTQDVLRELWRNGSLEGTVVVANHQHKGRGRQGHTWFALPEPQLYISILLSPPLPPEKLPMINVLAGLAVAEAAEANGVSRALLKWPNDLLVGGKKVAGILSELETSEGSSKPNVLLGIGVNVAGRVDDFPAELREKAAALSMYAPDLDRWELLADILNHLEDWYRRYLEEGPQPVRRAFEDRWVYRDRSISVMHGNERLVGRATEIDETGALLLDLGKGAPVRILAGEIEPSSLRVTT